MKKQKGTKLKQRGNEKEGGQKWKGKQKDRKNKN